MTLEFLVEGHGFDTCHEAMKFLTNKKSTLRQDSKMKYSKHNHHDWLKVANGLLALGKQCELQPTQNFEHYPRLTKEWALEILNQVYSIDSTPPNFSHDKKWLEQCNINYINNFDLMEYLHQYS